MIAHDGGRMKRLLDLLVALFLLVAGSPVLLLIALGVWLDVGSPILFR